MKKIRLYYWLIRAYIKRHTLRVVVSTVVSLLFIFNFSFFGIHFYRPVFDAIGRALLKPIVYEGVVGNVKVINPLYATSGAEKEISQLVFRGLTKTNAGGEVIPDLAEKVTATTDREFTFNLRRDIKWHDGHQFTADDVIYTYSIIANPDNKTGLEAAFKDIAIKKMDDFTVIFTLKEPFSPFLAQTSIGIIPAHIPLIKFKPVGTGDFRVVSFNKDRATLESGAVKLILKIYPTVDFALLALKQGQIQNLGGLTADQASEFLQWSNLKVTEGVYGNRYVGIFFNTKVGNLSAKSVRQAISYAVDKTKLVKDGDNQAGEPAYISIGKNSWAVSTDLKKYDFNTEQAGALLDKEGWIKQNDIRVKDGNPLTLSLAYTESPVFNGIADEMERQLKEIGIKVNKLTFNSSQLREQIINNRNFDMVLTTHELDADPDQYVFWHSTQASTTNITGLTSVRVDKALEDGRKTINAGERKDRYRDFQRALGEEAPALFLYYPKYYYITNSHLQNVDLSTFNAPINRFDTIGTWKFNQPFL